MSAQTTLAEPGGERRLETCSWVAFASATDIVTGCRAGGAGSSPTFQIRHYTLSGRTSARSTGIRPWAIPNRS